MTLLTPEKDDFAHASQVFLRSFGMEDMSMGTQMATSWRDLAESDVAHFVIARHNARVVGVGALFPYSSIAWIGWMGVEPGSQKRGIGRDMLQHLLGHADKAGIEAVRLDATDVGKKLYSRHGFTEECMALECKIACSPQQDVLSASAITVSQEIPRWCLDWDRHAFGGDRSTLLKFLLKKGAKLLVAGEAGYGLLRRKSVGPIVARNPQAATAVLRRASELGAENVYVPLRKNLPKEFRQCVNETGITYTRMVRGALSGDAAEHVYASVNSAMG